MPSPCTSVAGTHVGAPLHRPAGRRRLLIRIGCLFRRFDTRETEQAIDLAQSFQQQDTCDLLFEPFWRSSRLAKKNAASSAGGCGSLSTALFRTLCAVSASATPSSPPPVLIAWTASQMALGGCLSIPGRAPVFFRVLIATATSPSAILSSF